MSEREILMGELIRVRELLARTLHVVDNLGDDDLADVRYAMNEELRPLLVEALYPTREQDEKGTTRALEGLTGLPLMEAVELSCNAINVKARLRQQLRDMGASID